MNRILWVFTSLLITAVTSVGVFAGTPENSKQAQEFAKLTQLAGTWEGKMNEGKDKEGKDKSEPTTVTYEVTSGGSVVLETISPGTPHEMVTIYHKEGDTLAMTHYCALGNRPHMDLKKADAKSLFFDMDGTNGITSANEPHMHSLKLTMKDNDHLKQEWDFYNEGKKTETSVFNLTRKK
jgi:hypothetical protein